MNENKNNLNNMNDQELNNILDNEFKNDKLYNSLHNNINTVPKLKLFQTSFETPFILAEDSFKFFQKTLKFCNNNWYMLRSIKGGLIWTCDIDISYEISKKIKLYIDNAILFFKSEEQKEKNNKAETDDTIEEKYKLKYKALKACFKKFDTNSYITQYKKYLQNLLLDEEFETKLNNTPYKIVFENGIYDIKTKHFQSYILDNDYISETLPFKYEALVTDTNEKNKEWVLNEILKICNMDMDCRDFYLSILGYALCGDPSKYQEIYCLIGQSASNGKSTLIEALLEILPLYVSKSNVKVFESKFDKKHKYLVDFCKYRIIYANEFDDKQSIESSIFKEIADGNTISNEVMFGTNKTLNLTAKAFITSNYTPKFDKQDQGVARRYIHLQFNSKFGKKDNIENLEFVKDLKFKDKLLECKHELIDILLDYANKVYINGMPEYPILYKTEQQSILGMNNEFKEFFDYSVQKQNIIIDKSETTSISVLLNQYNSYSTKNGGENIIQRRVLIDKVKQLGFQYDRSKMIDGIRGVFIGFRTYEIDYNL